MRKSLSAQQQLASQGEKNMQNSLINSLHYASTFMRSISATVLVTFTMLILTPVVVAAKTELNKPAQAIAGEANSAESQLAKTLQVLKNACRK